MSLKTLSATTIEEVQLGARTYLSRELTPKELDECREFIDEGTTNSIHQYLATLGAKVPKAAAPVFHLSIKEFEDDCASNYNDLDNELDDEEYTKLRNILTQKMNDEYQKFLNGLDVTVAEL